jgi:Tol biopolymer transport system component
VRRVTAARALEAFPAWSPRGKPIAFDRDAGIEEKDWRELHLVQPNGKRLHKLTRRTWTITPAFTPDGAWIAYADSVRIWQMRLDGTRRQPLTTGSANGDSDPSFSPDGRFLVFSRSTAERGLEPWILDLRSGSERPLVKVPGNAPDWSPDGKWIVFVRYGRDGAEHLALVRPDGSSLHDLTAAAAR